MVYIPDEWFEKEENKPTVFDLLENETDQDKISKRLEELKETTILKKYIDCEINTQL